MAKREIIILSDSNSTKPYLNILKKYNISIRSTYGNHEDKKTAFSKELKELDDEEARNDLRTINKQLFEVLNPILGDIENRRKLRGLKLNTPKSIMTYFQKEKEKYVNENGTYGEVQAFLLNLLDARMHHFHDVPLMPKTDFRSKLESGARMKVAKHLVTPVLIERQLPSEINIKEIAEEVLKKEKSLADKKLVISIIKDFLNLK